jgi:hypothetical protein
MRDIHLGWLGKLSIVNSKFQMNAAGPAIQSKFSLRCKPNGKVMGRGWVTAINRLLWLLQYIIAEPLRCWSTWVGCSIVWTETLLIAENTL